MIGALIVGVLGQEQFACGGGNAGAFRLVVQKPVMFFAAEAKNGHAQNTNQPAKLWVCWPCWEAMISEKIASRFLVSFQLG